MADKIKFGIILNPNAGRGRARSAGNRIINYLQKRRIQFYLEMTNCPGHATEIARSMKNEFKTIIAAGGDGTVNEMMSGMIGGKSALAILPIGSGNDFNRIIGIPKKINQAVDTIISGKNKLFDLGEVHYWNQCGTERKRHFINTLGIGLDAEIANETKRIGFLRGLPLYLLATVRALSKHSPNEYNITTRNSEKTEKAFLICIGNGKYEGGGFKLLPDAVPDDSMLDICLIRNMSIWNALWVLPKALGGSFHGHKKVSNWNSKELKIESKRPFVLHGDGEVLEEKAVKARIKLAQKKVNIVIP
jgi:diacylglycerol kinase (ATP)